SRELRVVELVDRQAGPDDPPHLGVEPLARQRRVETRLRERRKGCDVLGEVALVGASDQALAQAERADDLGRRRQQRDDPHGPSSKLHSGSRAPGTLWAAMRTPKARAQAGLVSTSAGVPAALNRPASSST